MKYSVKMIHTHICHIKVINISTYLTFSCFCVLKGFNFLRVLYKNLIGIETWLNATICAWYPQNYGLVPGVR